MSLLYQFPASTRVSESAGSLNQSGCQSSGRKDDVGDDSLDGNMRKLPWTFAFTKALLFPMVKLASGCLMSSKRKPPLLGSPLKSSWQKLVGFVWKAWAGCDRTSFKCYMQHCIHRRSSLWTQPGISTSTRVDDAAAAADNVRKQSVAEAKVVFKILSAKELVC